MKRTQVQLDEATYQLLRAQAFERGMSISALVREVIKKHLTRDSQLPPGKRIFSFIGMGHGGEAPPYGPVSEHHDEAFAESILEK